MKNLVKIITFFILFAFVFIHIQNIIHYRWIGDEDLYSRNIDYSKASKSSIDVLCFGTSELWAAYAPIITYEESGITGYNFAIPHRSAVTAYYQLMYALKYQTPRVVMCDFSALYDDRLPSESDGIYEKVVDSLPDNRLKFELIKDICTIEPSQSFTTWLFPLLRYHTMWSELKEINFLPDYIYDNSYPIYQKGSWLNDEPFDRESCSFSSITPDLWEFAERDTSSFSSTNLRYYDMMINECQSRGIKVVALLPPKISSGSEYAARYATKKEYFDSKNVYCLNYNTYEQVERMGLNLETDYSDGAHLNSNGAIKFSRYLANDLNTLLDLPDHRNDPYYYDEWTNAVRYFNNVYLK
ncbi:MAG: hypothetical protein E7298_09495 [Lachnospiraceae bacterium]|nr:hypothetical protein [Lachnospiraceae bacterium]